jgi:Flp pilus assembly protein TadG
VSRLRLVSRGQALVEFALVFPIFILLVFGLIDIGRYVYDANAISQAAREGARYGSVADYVDAGANPPCTAGRDACIQQETLRRMAAVPSSTVDVQCRRQTGTGIVVVANADDCRTADFLIVQVATPFSMFTPVIAQIIGPQTLHSEARVFVNN